MARKRSELGPRAARPKYAMSESESESDNDFGYKVPHISSGTPERPISIPDPNLAGTPDEPIWISDVEVTDNDTETDTSNVAIRGTRSPRSSKVPPAAAFGAVKSKEKKNIVESIKSANSTSKKSSSLRSTPVVKTSTEVAPKTTPTKTPTVEATRMTPNKTSAKAPTKTPTTTLAKPSSKTLGSNRKLNNTLSEETPVSTNTTKRSVEKQAKHKETKLSTPAPAIDIASLSKEGDDPMLEQELEEISLNWRSGMISGTPAAHDIENGNKQPPIPSFMPPAAPIGEDEADRSWHNPIMNDKPKNNKRQRWYLLLSVAGLLTIIGCLIFVLKNNKNNNEVMETEPNLSQRQQTMHNLLVRVTDVSLLKNPNTPQHQARKWLLFQDRDLPSTDEERIIQRYVLACLFFSTSGYQKWNNNNWLAGDECGDEPWTGINCNSEGEVRAVVLGKSYCSQTLNLCTASRFHVYSPSESLSLQTIKGWLVLSRLRLDI